MTATVTDLFCGAGGSSLGATAAGLELAIGANHWRTAIDVHQVHFPEARHDCADITQVDPRRYPRTNILIASPECTNHSQARGVSRKRQDPTLWDAPDPAAERSRATMWDVVRFAEQMAYDAVVVENVVEATKWVLWPAWLQGMLALGYEHRVLSHNSMHHGVPQSRDRIYVVFWRKGLKPNLELEMRAWCPRCTSVRTVRQGWKNGRSVGRYRQQWTWACTTCGAACEPATSPAASIIDWGLPAPRIGDRARPLAAATRRRILAGLQRYGWAPIATSGAGHVYETTPGNRARPLTDPLPVQHATATTALATPPEGMVIQAAHGLDKPSRTRSTDDPMFTVTGTGSNGALATPPPFLVPLRSGRDRSHGVDEPMATVTAGGNYGFMVQPHHGGDDATRVRSVDEPTWTVTASDDRPALVVPLRRNTSARAVDGPVPTVCASGGHHALVLANNHENVPQPVDAPLTTVTTGNRHGLIMRNNSDRTDGAHMSTPTSEPIRTVTTTGHQSLLVPYNGTGVARPVVEPLGTQPATDRWSLVDVEQLVDDCGFRMLEPHEIAAAMAFPAGYIPHELTKKDRVKLAGNAVTPPVMTWICGRLLQALEAAS